MLELYVKEQCSFVDLVWKGLHFKWNKTDSGFGNTRELHLWRATYANLWTIGSIHTNFETQENHSLWMLFESTLL